jgi:protocatechuate 3,4-dioxygenase beta subunit
MRPAHIHVTVSADNYKAVTTQIYPKDDPWLATDTVFAVKDDLVVDFPPLKGDEKAEMELKYDFKLAPRAAVNGHVNGNAN